MCHNLKVLAVQEEEVKLSKGRVKIKGNPEVPPEARRVALVARGSVLLT